MDLLSEIKNVFPILERLFSPKELKNFISTKYIDLDKYHFSFGLWIRNNILKEGSSLERLFVKAGVLSKDDMSAFIIQSFYLYQKTK
ncbi:MAG: hypothetical protein IJ027_07755 [Oscillospiraceae bacterium]|nr:hypothetical protein [Oscillospiraceae bacterium]